MCLQLVHHHRNVGRLPSFQFPGHTRILPVMRSHAIVDAVEIHLAFLLHDQPMTRSSRSSDELRPGAKCSAFSTSSARDEIGRFVESGCVLRQNLCSFKTSPH